MARRLRHFCPMSTRDGPDFICIGLPKAGTRWLFDQLDDHPDFWMPPAKELVYLNQSFPTMVFTKRKPGGRGEHGLHRDRIDTRDQSFLDYARACRRQPMDLDRYAGLFGFKGDLLSGDISPIYWTLKGGTIAKVADRFPRVKIVLLARDPVLRAWSRISMAWRGGLFDVHLLHDAAGFKDYVDGTKKIGHVYATKVAERWRKSAPNLDFRAFLLDDIEGDPERARQGILDFLGAVPGKKNKTLAASYNRKVDEEKLEMTDIAKAVLVEHFAEELRASAAMFGGAARDWPAKYGL
jgi:hypothetical protein